MITITDIMREVRNCFPEWRLEGRFTISGGKLTAPLLLPGDWVLLEGAQRNAGVRQLDSRGVLPGAKDETFDGTVWLLRPPEDFLRLCAEITAWDAEPALTGIRREHFGPYSVEYADTNGVPLDWRKAFAARLIPWRRMYWKEGAAC